MKRFFLCFSMVLALAGASSLPDMARAQTVIAKDLDAITIDNAGFVDPKKVLAANAWRGASGQLVETLLRNNTGYYYSPTMRELLVRLMRLEATPPKGGAGKTGAFIEARVGVLTRMGKQADALELLAKIPAEGMTAGLVHLNIMNLLLADIAAEKPCARACEKATNAKDALVKEAGSPLSAWRIFCKSVNDNQAEAELAVQLLIESNEDREVDVPGGSMMLSELLLGKAPQAKAKKPVAKKDAKGEAKAEPSSGPAPGSAPLDLYTALLLERTGHPFALKDFVVQDAAIWGLLAQSKHLKPIDKLEAAERASMAGVITAEALLPYYAAVTEEGKSAVLRRAATINAITAAVETKDKLRILKDSWGIFAGTNRVGVLTVLYEKDALKWTESLKDKPEAEKAELAQYAGVAGKILAVSHHKAAVKTWWNLAKPTAPQIAAELWPFVRLGDDAKTTQWLPADLDKWVKDTEFLNVARLSLASRYYTLLTALGFDVPSEQWEPLYAYNEGEKAIPSTVNIAMLKKAATSKNMGELILLSADVFKGQLFDSVSTQATGDVIKALREAGLSEEASKLAVEAML